MFASRITKDVSLPSDPSVLVTIRKLSWLQRKSARHKSQVESAQGLREMGGPAFMREISAIAEDGKVSVAEIQKKAEADPLNTHDLHTVLICGVQCWKDPTPVTAETLGDLDEADAEFLAREILALSMPARTEEQEKNVA